MSRNPAICPLTVLAMLRTCQLESHPLAFRALSTEQLAELVGHLERLHLQLQPALTSPAPGDHGDPDATADVPDRSRASHTTADVTLALLWMLDPSRYHVDFDLLSLDQLLDLDRILEALHTDVERACTAQLRPDARSQPA